ncbi:uncharacterized protein LOC107968259 [Pan troglodytes]|uniref:uncharacterized protein LOC107968259 n=1 Tax=Pan troglodytes TaxID=9598 RepID=UPI00301328A0
MSRVGWTWQPLPLHRVEFPYLPLVRGLLPNFPSFLLHLFYFITSPSQDDLYKLSTDSSQHCCPSCRDGSQPLLPASWLQDGLHWPPVLCPSPGEGGGWCCFSPSHWQPPSGPGDPSGGIRAGSPLLTPRAGSKWQHQGNAFWKWPLSPDTWPPSRPPLSKRFLSSKLLQSGLHGEIQKASLKRHVLWDDRILKGKAVLTPAPARMNLENTMPMQEACHETTCCLVALAWSSQDRKSHRKTTNAADRSADQGSARKRTREGAVVDEAPHLATETYTRHIRNPLSAPPGHGHLHPPHQKPPQRPTWPRTLTPATSETPSTRVR